MRLEIYPEFQLINQLFMSRSFDLSVQLRKLTKDQLHEIIQQLTDHSDKNKEILKLYLENAQLSGEKEGFTLQGAKREVKEHLYGRSHFPVADYKRALNTVEKTTERFDSNPEKCADIQLYYVELATEIRASFGDFGQEFDTSLGHIFDLFCDRLNANPPLLMQFQERLNRVLSDASDCGEELETFIKTTTLDLVSKKTLSEI